jgi:endoglucanase
MRKILLVLFLIPGLVTAEEPSIYNKVEDVSAKSGFITKNIKDNNDVVPPDSSGMSNLISAEFAKGMGMGWNVGNSLDAIGGETAWGNPHITQTLIDSVKAAGFNSIRIPVAWSKFSDASTFTIDTNFMNRVTQVVNYVLKDSMYAIINIHWDGDWMQPTYAQQTYVNNRLATMWNQIAVHFRDFGDHLLFAGTNEVRVTNNYDAPTAEYAAVQNSFNQTFVNTVRATGGRNFFRYLLVQGFNTNINYTISTFIMPADAREKKLMVEVHYYDPYDFTINPNNTIIQWGKYAITPSRTETWANETYADGQFQKMKTKFIDNGYGVVLGEYGAMARLNLGSEVLNAQHAEYRRYYLDYISYSIVSHGLIPCYWDAGSTGDHGGGLFNRETGAQVYRDIIKSITDSVVTVNAIPYGNATLKTSESVKLYPNPAKKLFTLELQNKSADSCPVYNSTGQIITTFKVSQGTNICDISNLKAGLYYIKIKTPKGFATEKFLVE